MAHLYKAEEWESCGRWYVNDTNFTDSQAPFWWIPARILNITLPDYILLLKNIFRATDIQFIENKILVFSFDTIEDARKYKNYINKRARETNFII
jgi:hypothetical protein